MKKKSNYLKHILSLLICTTVWGPVMASGHTDRIIKRDSTQQKKVVFIIVDGIAYDMLISADTPFLDSIAKIGSFTKAYVGGRKNDYSETPTISAVGYNSLLTGTWANKHNVWGNGIENPNYNYPSIFRILKDRAPEKHIAIFSTWLDNRTKLIGEGLPATGNLKMNYAYDGFELDTLNFPHDQQRQFIKHIDKKVAAEAARYIKEAGPDLSWVYLEFSDDVGHIYGDSPQLYDAIRFEDSLVGGIWHSIKEREKSLNEDWLLVVTTDHGRTAKDGKGHGGQTERERSTWIVTNEPDMNSYFNEQVPGIVDIMPTISRFMNLEIVDDITNEMDGTPLIGPVDIFDLHAAKTADNKLKISWDYVGKPEEKASLFLTTTNKYADGGKDDYRKIGEVQISDRCYTISDLPPSETYKIVLRTKNNTINAWWSKNKEQSNKH